MDILKLLMQRRLEAAGLLMVASMIGLDPGNPSLVSLAKHAGIAVGAIVFVWDYFRRVGVRHVAMRLVAGSTGIIYATLTALDMGTTDAERAQQSEALAGALAGLAGLLGIFSAVKKNPIQPKGVLASGNH